MLSRLCRFSSKIISILAICLLAFGLIAPLSVSAQLNSSTDDSSTAGEDVIGFADCNFDFNAGEGDQQSASLANCLQSLLQFMFVVGIFLIAFRVALSAFGQFNPNESGQAVNKSITLVWDLVIGLLLIGAPALIIGLVNDAALNLDFIDFSGFQRSGLVADNNGTEGSGSGSSGSEDEGNNSTTVDKDANIDKEDFDILVAACSDPRSPLQGSNQSEDDEEENAKNCDDLNNELIAIRRDCDYFIYGFVKATSRDFCVSVFERYGEKPILDALAESSIPFPANIDFLDIDGSYSLITTARITKAIECTGDLYDIEDLQKEVPGAQPIKVDQSVAPKDPSRSGDFGCTAFTYNLTIKGRNYSVYHITGNDFKLASGYIIMKNSGNNVDVILAGEPELPGEPTYKVGSNFAGSGERAQLTLQ